MNSFKKYKTRFIYALNINSRKFFIFFFIILFSITTSIAYKIAENSFQPTVTTLAKSIANTFALELINDAVTEIANSMDYTSLTTINKNENGEIISIALNSAEINDAKLKITDLLIKTVNESTYEEVGVPIGNLTKSYFLSGRGPIIPIKLVITGSPKIDFKNNFESAGINQTKHSISVMSKVEFDIILPYDVAYTSMTTETMLCETIIVGKIPEVYISK